MAKDLFTEEEQAEVRIAIQHSEERTSSPIKVHIEGHCKEDTIERASTVFEQLQLHKAELRNGILFYLAIKDKAFAVIGDVGVQNALHKDFWNQISELMLNYFQQGEFVKGLVEGVLEAGKQLEVHFPNNGNNPSQLFQ